MSRQPEDPSAKRAEARCSAIPAAAVVVAPCRGSSAAGSVVDFCNGRGNAAAACSASWSPVDGTPGGDGDWLVIWSLYLYAVSPALLSTCCDGSHIETRLEIFCVHPACFCVFASCCSATFPAAVQQAPALPGSARDDTTAEIRRQVAVHAFHAPCRHPPALSGVLSQFAERWSSIIAHGA